MPFLKASYSAWHTIIILCLLLSGCFLQPSKPLRLGSNVWVGYESLYLARSLGFFEEQPVKLVELPSATEVIHAFRQHSLEIAALTLDETLSLLQTETDIKIILVFDISDGGDALLANPSIKSLAQIKGKRIGVEKSSVGPILLDGALSSVQLTSSDIEIVPLTVNEHLFAFLNKKVDAVITFDPVKEQLLSAGAINLFDSSNIPNRIFDVLITRQSVINQRTHELRKLLSAYFKALDYISKNPSDAYRQIAPRMGLSADTIPSLYQGLKIPGLNENHHLLNEKNNRFKQNINNLANLMFRKNLLFKPVNGDTLIDGSLLPDPQ